MKPASALVVAAVVMIMSSCSGDHSKEATPTFEAKADRAALPEAKGVDTRRPEQSVPVVLRVAPVEVPDRARAGTRVRAVFQTRPDASCQLEVFYGDESSEPVRLAPAVADRTGLVSWTWMVDDDATGIATAHVVCSGGQRGQADITVV